MITDKVYYSKVFDILVKHAEVNESLRENFIYSHWDSKFLVEEYRIQGKLGFGGKFRRRRNEVDCYKEDETPEVLKVIDAINYDIRALNKDVVQFKTDKAEGLFIKVPNGSYGFTNDKASRQIYYIENVPYKKQFLKLGSSIVLNDYWDDNFKILDVTEKLTQEQLEQFIDEKKLIGTKGKDIFYPDYNIDGELTTDIKDSLLSLMIFNKIYPLDIADEWDIPENIKGTWLVILKK